MWGSTPQQSANHQCDVSNTVPIPIQLVSGCWTGREEVFRWCLCPAVKFPNDYQVSVICCSSHSLTKLLQLGYQRDQAHCHLRGWVSSLQPGSVSESFCLFISLLYPRSTCLRNMHTRICISFCLSSTLLMDSWHQRWPTLMLSVRNKSWSYLRDALVTVR